MTLSGPDFSNEGYKNKVSPPAVRVDLWVV